MGSEGEEATRRAGRRQLYSEVSVRHHDLLRVFNYVTDELFQSSHVYF